MAYRRPRLRECPALLIFVRPDCVLGFLLNSGFLPFPHRVSHRRAPPVLLDFGRHFLTSFPQKLSSPDRPPSITLLISPFSRTKPRAAVRYRSRRDFDRPTGRPSPHGFWCGTTDKDSSDCFPVVAAFRDGERCDALPRRECTDPSLRQRSHSGCAAA